MLPNSPAALSIRNLSKTFRSKLRNHQVLAKISLSVSSGEILCILGPSGCGKSTLLRIVAGLESADPHPELEISLCGEEICGPGPDRGFVFQSYSSLPWLSAKENVMFGLESRISDKRERARIAEEYLGLVNLLDHANFLPRDLSGGQQQRVAIARTLAMKPRLLLMDEPYAALDALNRELQQLELLKIWNQARPTILFVTHDIAEAVFLGKRVVVLSSRPGRVAADVATDGELKIEGERGLWLRDQPEFRNLVGRLRELLLPLGGTTSHEQRRE